MNKRKMFIILIICLITSVVIVKLYCDKSFICPDEALIEAVGAGTPVDEQIEILESQTYTYCRFSEMKVAFDSGNYDLFKATFNDFYQNHCNDYSRFMAFREIFCLKEELSEKELEVLLDVLNEAYEYDFSNYGYEANGLIQTNLKLQIDLLYTTGHPFKAYEKKVFFEKYIEEYSSAIAMEELK